ncbi:DUF3375 domain-containing protein [Gynurincola endophyticus]|uniref:DUF3375 domain-containing protein n=1 Tax=Gynurincola endophyticus TaxID=2479004 RepID=UPI000F8D280D|nr:DUF3375 domain-containing protein [Gynurincola endophyticus]
MNKATLEMLLASSPALQMLRLKNAHWVLPFLYQIFKIDQKSTVTEEVLVQALSFHLQQQEDDADILQETHIEFGDDDEARSRKYLTSWVQKRILQDTPDAEGVIHYQLSAYTEKVFQWLQQLQERQFVGTESRFKMMFHHLKDLVEYTEDNKQKRLELLKERKANIEKEIKALELGSMMHQYTNAQVQERLHIFNKMCYDLLSDFTEVEDNFKQIHRRIVEQHTKGSDQKSTILEFAFHAYDALRESDQGRSFYAFWDFLISRKGQTEWELLSHQLLEVLAQRSIDTDQQFLASLKSQLLQKGKKVSQANDRMAEKLSRIITEKEITKHRRLRKQINAIKELAFQVRDSEEALPGIEIDESLTMPFVMDRKISLLPGEKNIELLQPSAAKEEIADYDRLSKMLNTTMVDKKVLKERVQESLNNKETVTLLEILEKYPLQHGIAEVVTYFALNKDPQLSVQVVDKTTELVPLGAGKNKFVEVPYLLFSNKKEKK